IEGNPVHPSTRGSSNAQIQASILGLYDPDRSKHVMHNGVQESHDSFVSFWREKLLEFQTNKGEGLAVLAEPFSSPTLARLKKDFGKSFPKAQWVTYEPLSGENIYKAIKNQTKQSLISDYHYEKADVILSLDSDFLGFESDSINSAQGFIEGRRLETSKDKMNRLYVVENGFSLTGGMADHRLRMRSSEIGSFLISLALELRNLGLGIDRLSHIKETHFDTSWIKAVAQDLHDSSNGSIITVGRNQPVWVHELAFILNYELGNIGDDIVLRPLTNSMISDTDELVKLVSDINNNKISTLIILGGNPVYNAPQDLDFSSAIKKAENTIHFSEYFDETSQSAEWHVPKAHYLESWGDVRNVDGTAGIIQPMIEPLFNGKSDSEFYSLIATGNDNRGYDIVRETWRGLLSNLNYETEWKKTLHDGIKKGVRNQSSEPQIKRTAKSIEGLGGLKSDEVSVDNLEVSFYPSRLYDGRYSNNGWLQELPDPVTKISWDNPALISQKTADELSLENNDMVRIGIDNRSLDIPVWIVPGQADYTICLSLGYGRKQLGSIANSTGFNTYELRIADSLYIGQGAKIARLNRKYELANTQDHSYMEGRPIIREASLDEYRKHPDFAKEMVEHPPLKSIFPDHDYSKGYQWGMVIDLNACIGCNACTIACQSENNIPIVGKEQVTNGREMHWIRNDRYFSGNSDEPEMLHMPVACQHCETAPCESVCPVAATVHDSEGLNAMTYNRCIGTRYCSNNCPYKVRRFNFFNYTNDYNEVVKMSQNPDVSVRSRGVMEKCTFCIQRINRAKRNAKIEKRQLSDKEVLPACMQACPANAIYFGDINNPESEVSKLKRNERNYELLAELNVRPRNSYLAKIRNPNPELVKETKKGIDT
ncbi:MAG: 4Fe-4S dicluster domain-containing protein, partial [candidate division Zixibacteria bacterium]|nr:4Fe-4S dicluster domain-containing protein [candidate division Zixibacteria bacterium]